MATTNYIRTFIAIADDCPVKQAEIPPLKKESPTAGALQLEMILANPYRYTSDDVLFHVFAIKNNIRENVLKTEREKFFSKSQACLRASPLPKRYGWGIHHNEEGKIAVYPMESGEYQAFLSDDTVTQVKALRSKRSSS